MAGLAGLACLGPAWPAWLVGWPGLAGLAVLAGPALAGPGLAWLAWPGRPGIWSGVAWMVGLCRSAGDAKAPIQDLLNKKYYLVKKEIIFTKKRIII